MVLWASLDERLEPGIELGTHVLPEGVHPRGYRSLLRFEARPFPRWTYRAAGGKLVRELFLVHGTGDVLLSYRWDGPGPITLILRPLLAFRDHHEVVRGGTEGLVDRHGEDEIVVRFRWPEPRLRLLAPGGRFHAHSQWLNDEVLPMETYRGLPDREDLWSPGAFVLTLEPGRTRWVIGGVASPPRRGAPAFPDSPEACRALRRREQARREALRLPWLRAFDGLAPLAQAADQFLVRRGERTTVLAGYPWFTDWGRDTMIALPGLTLATGRAPLARDLLLTFVNAMRDGLIPNRFPDAGDVPEYNTVDATLWMAVAAYWTWRETRDRSLVEAILPALREARRRHEEGTRHGIHVDADGLLACGEEGVQLTWMDAKVDDWVVTPRRGKPVEVQALWYNFLRVGEEMERAAGSQERAASWREAAERVRRAFSVFWDPRRGYLADVIAPDGSADWSLRPNQVLALSLPFPLADREQARAVLAHVREKLLTPRGLRSLAPGHPDYHPRYGGDRRARDAAYHQGTVWGWLHGPYLDAVLRFEGEAGREEARALLSGWAEHLGEGCLGQAAEIFDAEPPHAPRGCPAQAWTVAEILRVARALAETEADPPAGG